LAIFASEFVVGVAEVLEARRLRRALAEVAGSRDAQGY
jgi:hypothetical protein